MAKQQLPASFLGNFFHKVGLWGSQWPAEEGAALLPPCMVNPALSRVWTRWPLSVSQRISGFLALRQTKMAPGSWWQVSALCHVSEDVAHFLLFLICHQCSRTCGGGVKVRGIHCIDTRGQRPLRPFHCQTASYKPPAQLPCHTKPCLSWYTSTWREVSRMSLEVEEDSECNLNPYSLVLFPRHPQPV